MSLHKGFSSFNLLHAAFYKYLNLSETNFNDDDVVCFSERHSEAADDRWDHITFRRRSRLLQHWWWRWVFTNKFRFRRWHHQTNSHHNKVIYPKTRPKVHFNKKLTLTIPNFLNGKIHLTFLELSNIILGRLRWKLGSWSANSIESGQTARKCRLAWLYTVGNFSG